MSKKYVNGQSEFGFVAPMRRAVMSLLRWTKSGRFNQAVSYGEWLEWHCALNGGAR